MRSERSSDGVVGFGGDVVRAEATTLCVVVFHISDIIDAYIKAGEFNGNFEVFNIGYGKSYSVEEIVDKTVCLYGKNVKVEYSGETRT